MIKYTSNYICYFSTMNKIQCAKCRLTGRFVKRAIAQAEYSKEYVYIAYMSMFSLIYIIVVMNVQSSLNKLTMQTEAVFNMKTIYQAVIAPYSNINSNLINEDI